MSAYCVACALPPLPAGRPGPQPPFPSAALTSKACAGAGSPKASSGAAAPKPTLPRHPAAAFARRPRMASMLTGAAAGATAEGGATADGAGEQAVGATLGGKAIALGAVSGRRGGCPSVGCARRRGRTAERKPGIGKGPRRRRLDGLRYLRGRRSGLATNAVASSSAAGTFAAVHAAAVATTASPAGATAAGSAGTAAAGRAATAARFGHQWRERRQQSCAARRLASDVIRSVDADRDLAAGRSGGRPALREAAGGSGHPSAEQPVDVLLQFLLRLARKRVAAVVGPGPKLVLAVGSGAATPEGDRVGVGSFGPAADALLGRTRAARRGHCRHPLCTRRHGKRLLPAVATAAAARAGRAAARRGRSAESRQPSRRLRRRGRRTAGHLALVHGHSRRGGSGMRFGLFLGRPAAAALDRRIAGLPLRMLRHPPLHILLPVPGDLRRLLLLRPSGLPLLLDEHWTAVAIARLGLRLAHPLPLLPAHPCLLNLKLHHVLQPRPARPALSQLARGLSAGIPTRRADSLRPLLAGQITLSNLLAHTCGLPRNQTRPLRPLQRSPLALGLAACQRLPPLPLLRRLARRRLLARSQRGRHLALWQRGACTRVVVRIQSGHLLGGIRSLLP
eukprot:scaffold7308_cov114-Isochrysis_galbana.AAC.8